MEGEGQKKTDDDGWRQFPRCFLESYQVLVLNVAILFHLKKESVMSKTQTGYNELHEKKKKVVLLDIQRSSVSIGFKFTMKTTNVGL